MDIKALPHRAPRLPQFPIERPLEQRTSQKDEEALALAQFAVEALQIQRCRRKSRAHKVDAPAHRSENTASAVTCDKNVGADSLRSPRPPKGGLRSDRGDIGRWPKYGRDLGVDGALQFSWSNIGFPNESQLTVKDLKDESTIDREDLNVLELAEDVRAIKEKPAVDIADDGQVEIVTKNQRTIETFQLRGRRVAKVKFEDVDATQKGFDYSQVKAGKAFEKALDEVILQQRPSLELQQRVLAHVLLARGGQIGGRTNDFWKTARNLAQQHIFVSPELAERFQGRLQKGGESERDEAYDSMLGIVEKCLAQNAFNPYYQAQRDDFAVAHNLFDHIADVDMVMIVDKHNDIINFVCCDAIGTLFSKRMERDIEHALDTFSTRNPTPLPDMTRHGLHYCQWLVEHPELDFRNHGNDPHKAKSGVYHYGCRFAVGDPQGEGKGLKIAGRPFLTDDSMRVYERPVVNAALEFSKLRHGALAALTEAVSFFFELLEPALFARYRAVVAEARRALNEIDLDFVTRKEAGEEPFAMRAVLVNLMTNEHKDTGDWQNGIVGLTMVGDYKGGDLLLRELGLRISSGPGSVQLMRGRELRHSITRYTGPRYVVVHTNHEAVRRWALRRLSEPVTESGSATVNSCLDKEAEDCVPESQNDDYVMTEFPERHEDDSDRESSDVQSEASVAQIVRPPKRDGMGASSSSPASAEESVRGAHEVVPKRIRGSDAHPK